MNIDQIICLIIGITMGTVQFIIAVYFHRRARSSRQWPSTTGIVLKTDVEIIKYEGSCQPIVTYEYQVAGKSYTGNKITLTQGSQPFIPLAKKCLSSYPESTELKVYYNPNKPEDSVLIPGLTIGVWGCYFAGSIFLGIAIAPFIFNTRFF